MNRGGASTAVRSWAEPRNENSSLNSRSVDTDGHLTEPPGLTAPSAGSGDRRQTSWLRLIAEQVVAREAPTRRARDLIRFTHVNSSACCNAPAEPARSRNEPLSQAARAQPGRLVSLGGRSADRGQDA